VTVYYVGIREKNENLLLRFSNLVSKIAPSYGRKYGLQAKQRNKILRWQKRQLW
jgi:hypothetical protein